VTAPAEAVDRAPSRAKRAGWVLGHARVSVPVGTLWQHKKGGRYTVVGHALNTDDGTAMVLYRRVGGPDFNSEVECETVYARPFEQWTYDRFTRAQPTE
jgi:hypothetical protein